MIADAPTTKLAKTLSVKLMSSSFAEAIDWAGRQRRMPVAELIRRAVAQYIGYQATEAELGSQVGRRMSPLAGADARSRYKSGTALAALVAANLDALPRDLQEQVRAHLRTDAPQ